MSPLASRSWSIFLAILGASLLVPSPRGFAADGTWTNTAGGTLAWTNITNWSGGILPSGIDAIANFATVNIIGNTTVSLTGTNPIVGTLLFADTTPSHTWGMNNTGTINLSVTSGSPVISNSVTATLNAIFAGSQGFTKLGSAVLILGGANTYSGNTVISEGTLRLNANETLPNDSVVVFANNANNKELTVYSQTDTIGGLSSSGGAGTIMVQNNRATNSGTLNLNVAAATSLTYDGTIRDAGSATVNNLNIIKSGAGTQVFSGGTNVSYSGATTVSNGVMEFAGATVNNNSAISVSSGATMRFNNTSTIDRTNVITGAGNLEKSGSGVLTLSASNTYGGSTIMTGGNLRLGANERISDSSVMRFTGGSGTDSRFQMMGYSETLGGLNSDLTTGTQVIEGAATAAATLTLVVESGLYDYSGFLRDTSGGVNANNLSLVKNGAGTQVLSGAGNVSYSGATTVNGGALEFAAGTVNNNTAIDVADSSAAIRFNVASGTATRTNTISGSGALVKVGAGALALSNVNTYTGATVLEEGFIRLAASDRISDASVLRFATTNDARFQMQGFSETLGGLDSGSSSGTQVIEGSTNAAATLTLSIGEGSYTYDGFLRDAVSGTNANNLSLVKDGAGTQVLTGGTTQVSYSGGTTVNGGVLEFAGANSVANNSAITLGGGTVRFSGGGARDNTIAGSGNLEKTGANTLTLSGSNTFSGGTLVSAGTLQFNDGGSVAGNITNNAALLYDRSDSVIVGNIISGSGALTKTGAGTVTLTGNNSYDGVTTVSASVLRIANSNALGSTNGGTVVQSGAQLRLITGVSNSISSFGNGEALTISGDGGSALGALRSGVAGETNIYQGKVTLAANATINAGSGTALTLDVVSGDAVDLGGNTLTFLGSGAHAVTGAIIGTGGIIKTSSGTTTLSGMSSYTGATTISNGVLRAGASAGGQAFGNLSAVTLASAPANQTALDLNNHNQTIGSLAGGGVGGNNLGVLLGSGTLTTGGNNTSTTFDGQISGTGGLVKTGSGTQTLTASNSFTGAVAINAGVLELASTAGGAAADAVSFSVATNAILLLSQSQQVKTTATVSLSGGTIQRGSGVSEVFGDLSITTGSFLDFGTGTAGNLTFGTYQDNETPSALLTLSNFLPGNSFTFTSTSFTTNSVGSYFTFGTGYAGSSISSSGSTFTITAIPEPSTMVVAAALAGFFALSACRFRPLSRLSDSPPEVGLPSLEVGRLPEKPSSLKVSKSNPIA